MDYLNYGKQVQQRPQGFGNKVQLTKDDFSFGNLSQQSTPLSPRQDERQDQLLQLFPTPLLICPCPFNYDKELEWIKKQPNRKDCKKIGFNGEFLNRQSEDTFVLDKPELSRVRQFIEVKLKEYVVKIMGSNSEMVITQSWFNKNNKGESHHEHTHQNSMISGVWYPQIHEKLPPIQFKIGHPRDVSLPVEKFNHFNSSQYMLPMKMGELILFPSHLQHCVPANQSDEERISLSFNTWCKGNLGDKESLTYLPLDRCV